MSLDSLTVPATLNAAAPGVALPAGPPGPGAYEQACLRGFVGTEDEWLASYKGEKGGPGADGASAYDLARSKGFVGTEDDYLASLRGAPGRDGTIRSVGGASGADLSLADIGALPAIFMRLTRAPVPADIPAGQHRMVYRSDTDSFAWVANLDGVLRNILDPAQY